MNTFFAIPFFSLALFTSPFGFTPHYTTLHAPTAQIERSANPSATHTFYYTRHRTAKVYQQQSAPTSISKPVEVQPTPAPEETTPAPATDMVATLEVAIHDKINAERVKNGLSPLALDSRLASIARAHSEDMLKNDYFSHTNQSGCSASCRYKEAGYSYRSMGENIYMMSGYTLAVDPIAEKIVQGWMNSSGHRANILNKSYTVEGIGIAVEGKKVYATENFALPR